MTLFHQGELLFAKEHSEAAIALYDRVRDEPLTSTGISNGASALSYRSWILWHLGYPDQALKTINEATTLAEELARPDSLAFALGYACYIRCWRREVQPLEELATRNIALCSEYGLASFLATAKLNMGWVMAARGQGAEGTTLLAENHKSLRAAGFKMTGPTNLAMLADASLTAGCFDEGLQAVSEALAVADAQEEHLSTAELHRLRGELLLGQDPLKIAEPQSCFQRAIEIARSQSAKSFELRAMTSLARLLARQGRREEARAMLAEVYGWFTEGFDTADLKQAKALLNQLA
ncbi:MAG: hypothetical protein ACREQT_04795 [Candidatus Binataceae bacterium]